LRHIASTEHLAELRAEWDRRIALGDLDQTIYLRIATECALWRSRCEAALRSIAL
jgi:hypothetical protein